jgi:hypothetical protein
MKNDVIDSFNKAIEADENVAKGVGTTNFWNYVESDMYMDLSDYYADTYIQECFDKLADNYLDTAWQRLQVLKTDFLGC